MKTVNEDQAAFSCDFDPNSITVTQAITHIAEVVSPVTDTESIPLTSAMGRVTSENIVSPENVPNHTNSAMDGYAICTDDLLADQTREFELVGASFAGKAFSGVIGSGQCVRIMTGAVMPDGTDSVVIQENVSVESDKVFIPSAKHIGAKKGANVRYAGEDLKAGEVAIPAHLRLRASHLGVIASLGIGEVNVFRRPRIAYFSNGDELRSIGMPLEKGEVYDSNRYTLNAMLSDLGVEQIDLGIVKDDPIQIAETFKSASLAADMIITTAGASVGDADYIKQTLSELGQVSFWKVAVKPGRPLSFGKLKNSLFFGLPGNPVSVMVTFKIFVKSAIKQLSGEKFDVPMKLRVRLIDNLRKKPGRMEYQRGVLSIGENGDTVVTSTGEQGSGILSSMSQANCFIILADDSTGAKAGELVEVQPFDANS